MLSKDEIPTIVFNSLEPYENIKGKKKSTLFQLKVYRGWDITSQK